MGSVKNPEKMTTSFMDGPLHKIIWKKYDEIYMDGHVSKQVDF